MHNCCAQIPSMVHESYKNVPKPQTEQTLALLRLHPLGKQGCLIGKVTDIRPKGSATIQAVLGLAGYWNY